MARLLHVLPVLALASLGVLAATVTAPPAEASGNANLVCCENDNGTYHPVSSNGRAIDHCAQTWDIPEGESPGTYCDDGPPDPTCEGQPDPATCYTVAGCYWGFPGPACNPINSQ